MTKIYRLITIHKFYIIIILLPSNSHNALNKWSMQMNDLKKGNEYDSSSLPLIFSHSSQNSTQNNRHIQSTVCCMIKMIIWKISHESFHKHVKKKVWHSQDHLLFLNLCTWARAHTHIYIKRKTTLYQVWNNDIKLFLFLPSPFL